ncbi:otolith morphogenesis [Desmophyllum pertusum]|uniref:Otolith morphogenesis n=1 Tax=Desmophyllum pertusum TaxID=174260 RepID=A0A9X0D7Q2_9CNID|nr:otolith morphogenesis [Desmophyllum pertusum]
MKLVIGDKYCSMDTSNDRWRPTFTQEPVPKLCLQEGSNAVLTWDYKVDNRTAELQFIIWKHCQYMGTERLKKEGRATLVIKDITFEDSTNYYCILRGETGASLVSIVELIVTGNA